MSGSPLDPDKSGHESATATAPRSWAAMLGLHPLVAFGMIACDFMLFGGEAATAGVGLTLTIPIAIALVVPCLLLQRFSYGDDWGSAAGKALMVGVLTAIPFPIGSPVTLVGGVLGFMRPKPALPAANTGGIAPHARVMPPQNDTPAAPPALIEAPKGSSSEKK